MLTAIVGINWGDEGKGRMVDLLSSRYDIVCRYQGGNNAGIDTIWFNPGRLPLTGRARPTYTADSYDQILRILSVPRP